LPKRWMRCAYPPHGVRGFALPPEAGASDKRKAKTRQACEPIRTPIFRHAVLRANQIRRDSSMPACKAIFMRLPEVVNATFHAFVRPD